MLIITGEMTQTAIFATKHGRNVLTPEVTMSLTPNARRRQGFLIGRQIALRATSNVVEQLQEWLEAERAYAAELQRELAVAKRELFEARLKFAEARLEIARRNIVDAYANAPSPSAMVH
jgi:hypothetical protein